MSTERNADDLLRIVLIVLAVLVLFPLLMMLFAVPMMGMMGGGWGWGGGMTGDVSPLWSVGMLLVWAAVILGVGYLLYRGITGDLDPSEADDRALEELRLAYARGDLTDEEFEERRSKLGDEKSR